MTWGATVWSVLGGCVSIAVLAIAVLALAGYISGRVNVARFLRRYRGRCLLLCSRRHGWYHFIVNNVVPAMPPEVELVWSDPDASATLRALRALGVRGEKPLLVCVHSRRPKSSSLHAAMLPLETSAARDERVQQTVKELLDRAIEELATRR